mgnify:CR=1 FL=1
MKKNIFIFLSLFIAISLTSCEKDDDIRLSQVPDGVMATFQGLYPQAEYVEWEKKKEFYVADFFSGGTDLQVWINKSGAWSMTESDVRLANLPEAVQNAFKSSIAVIHSLCKIQSLVLMKGSGIKDLLNDRLANKIKRLYRSLYCIVNTGA